MNNLHAGGVVNKIWIVLHLATAEVAASFVNSLPLYYTAV